MTNRDALKSRPNAGVGSKLMGELNHGVQLSANTDALD